MSKLWLVLAAMLLLPLSWFLGHRAGQRALVEPLLGAAGTSTADGTGVSGPQSLAGLRQSLDTLRTERDMATATVRSLKEKLVAQEARRDRDAAELALYRRIEQGDAADGIGVESVVRGPESLIITLVQSRGRDRVSGELTANVWQDDADTPRHVELGVANREAGTEFDFRFFERIEVPLTLPPDFEPSRLEIEVTPTRGKHPPVQQSWAWADIPNT